MSHQSQFLTIAGRWTQHVAASGINKVLPRRDQVFPMLMFYAGFSAALDAAMELAALDEGEAVQLLEALRTEVKQVEGMAARLLGGASLS